LHTHEHLGAVLESVLGSNPSGVQNPPILSHTY